jgi:CDP-diacylglycerol---glycerol-3-phosphate 3-phosphatidyltransferase
MSTRAGVDPASQPAQTAHVVNIANALTLIRLLLVPVFIVVLFANGGHSSGWRIWAFVVFAVATITDFVDGDLARSRGLVTDVGKVADPIADKALTGAALIGLSILGDLPWWVTIVILVREVGVTGLRFFVIRHGVIPASRGGKAKTALQNVAIGLYLLPLSGWAASLRFWLMAAAVVVTVVTGADYVARALRLRQTSPRAEMKRARRAASGR